MHFCYLPPLQSLRGSNRDSGFDASEVYRLTAGPSKAGSGSPPTLAISARTRCTFLTSQPASRELLLSQAGPFAARVFNVAPTRASPYPVPCFASSCCAASGSRYRWRRAGAAVADSL